MHNYENRDGLKVAQPLVDFIEQQALPGTGVASDVFWSSFAQIVRDLSPINRQLLEKREKLQTQIDEWYVAHKSQPIDADAYKSFLHEIGYLVPEGADFSISTQNVDPEIASLAGPQLVVPVMNARFALNAANARWGSLYDALYGTDAIIDEGALVRTKAFNQERGAEVVRQANQFLDAHCPLAKGSHADVAAYEVAAGALIITLTDGQKTELKDRTQWMGYNHDQDVVSQILLKHHGLHIELQFDAAHPIGAKSASGLKDVIVEAALTTIQDCEDSVAAVDVDDKVQVYSNWLGLMKGDLQGSFVKQGKELTRNLAKDRTYQTPKGANLTLPGRSVMLVRNVGHLMLTDAVLDQDGQPIPEGILDAAVTSLCAMHDLQKSDGLRNSRTGSVYIVKPKMHGPEEASFTNNLFDRVEDMLGLSRHTLKVGVMDEERRTSVNLKECIRAVKDRLVFINTGFLDRTGDEIHTCMQAGPVLPKNDMKSALWLGTYEDNNVDIGLQTGLRGKAQIGKGMWAKPDAMAEMLSTKQGHPEAGANTAWVPSPTAAVLHAMHYHAIDVAERQEDIAKRARASLESLLTPPLLNGRNLSDDEVQNELDNSCQSILGYVVRWIDQGIGCSKVPDINDVGLMEDRATLRISSQHLANWLLHGICSADQIEDSLARMAVAVDKQNGDDPAYQPMSSDMASSIAFQAARALIFEGKDQPSGYTEPILHQKRQEAKAQQ